ncbi:hypothetical protein APA_2138 [Pseudanabaena sp. lw0831]|nr:hypothetical protein APA_2138 [Pseudanabaena sp. lw0831]
MHHSQRRRLNLHLLANLVVGLSYIFSSKFKNLFICDRYIC